MDLKTTNQIRGILVWMIFFRHCIFYFPKNIKRNKISILIDKSFGQNIVSPFLFYSGYGINESFLKKGNKYIKSLPIKSFIIFIKFQIILLVYLFDNYLNSSIKNSKYLFRIQSCDVELLFSGTIISNFRIYSLLYKKIIFY